MQASTQSHFDAELQRLEQRIDELVALADRLRDENRALRQRQETISAERTALLHKNEQVRARVEAMIGRLRTLEQGA
jgi:cell division protein ZapB